MSEIKTPASTGMLDGADSEIARGDNGTNSMATRQSSTRIDGCQSGVISAEYRVQ